MSTNPELNLRKRRGDGPNHQPNKKVKHVASASASRGLQITQEGQQDESTKQKPEELALNGKSIVEGKQDIKKKKSKQKRNKEDVPNVQGLEERELEKNEISPPQNGITPKQKKKGKEFVGEDTIKAVNSIHARSSKDRKVRLKGPMKEFSWSISQPLGGCFVPLDPVFSVDEKYLLLATKKSLNIYSTTTSLLVRRLYTGGKRIVGVKISPTHPNFAYIGDESGTVDLWNWVDGSKIFTVQHQGTLHTLDVIISSNPDTETIYLLGSAPDDENSSKNLSQVSVFTVHTQSPTSISQLYQCQHELQMIQVLNGGELVFAGSNSVVVIGKRIKSRPGQTGEELNGTISEYRWDELGFPQGLTCFNAHSKSSTISDTNKGSQPKKTKGSGSVDVAFGSSEGSIFVYEDIANKTQKLSSLRPRKLHWHRNSVGSVKWSTDGNYLISGGRETVLFLWQMETGKTQQLPHLTAAIKAINVSPSGTSYALLLDDNSVMALSTSELVPTAVVGGLQIAGVHSRLDTDWSFNKSKELIHPIPAVANAFFPNQIFLATPASQTIENKTLSAPFIQTFDWATGRHVSRQALARNNVTNINTAPDGTAIIEANVTLMKISHDGLWLATAEEWTPTTSNQPGEAYSLAERRETYLKFWHWDTKNNQWMLEARIDSPHQSTTLTGANQILDLESNPTEVGFASAGQDGIVRVWSPKTKLSDGRIVKGVNLKGVTTWLCTQLIDIGKTVDISDPDADSQFSGVPSFAKIAFSDDGSVLAVSLEDAKSISPGLVHFIDVMSGTIRLSQPLVYGAGLAALQFLGRHLIVLSSELRVWDMVTNRLVYGYPLKQGNLPQVWKQNLNQLNASKKYGRFIISVPVLDNSNGSRLFSRIAVFDPLDPQPYLIHEMPTIVSSLIPLDSAYGFAIIDSEAEIRLVKPNVASAMDPLRLGEIMETGPVQDAIVQQAPEGNVFPDAEDNFQDDDHDDADDSESNQSDNGRNAVVGAHNLAKIFDSSPSFALPPVQDLFRAVASLYLGKSKTTIKQSGAVTAPKS